MPAASLATAEAPFRALGGAAAWPIAEAHGVLAKCRAACVRPLSAEAWVVFEDGTYGVFILHAAGERRMYCWKAAGNEHDWSSCASFVESVAADGRILPEMRARLHISILFSEPGP